MNKRGVEMSLQTIVIAVILLLIAGILIYMTGTKLGAFNNAVQDCTREEYHLSHHLISTFHPHIIS